MDVKLIGFTPNPEKTPAMAAKLTHSKTKPEELDKTPGKELTAVLEQVMKLGHTSVVEHASFTFAISDVSRSLTHQLVRHRIASYSQQSQRYVNLNEPNYVTPPKIAKDKKMKKAYDETMTSIWKEYNKLLDMGIPAEDARYVLPNATCTNIMVTMNARSLLNFFELRCCLHAQWEIRELANKMLKEVKKVAPIIFKNAGPSCKTKNYCPENKKDCPIYPK
ncbi:MAG: FAD-dependent thymidylate synthase [Candidatus Thermoplasmatota archaeon]|jgi:thymidylate synthase (FAD)|nr:FAD-dependent thymidylate synthase [Candidatus Thermoplasmatota archaeon]